MLNCEIRFEEGGAITYMGHPVPRDVYMRAKRLDRKFPNNYPGGYLFCWLMRETNPAK